MFSPHPINLHCMIQSLKYIVFCTDLLYSAEWDQLAKTFYYQVKHGESHKSLLNLHKDCHLQQNDIFTVLSCEMCVSYNELTLQLGLQDSFASVIHLLSWVISPQNSLARLVQKT